VLGSAGGPARARPLLGRSPFLIVNGDTLTDLDVRALVDAHRATGALVTMAVVPNTEPDKYGGVAADEEGRVAGFVPRGSTAPSWHFIGVQVAEAEAFATVPPGVPHESAGALYPALIAARPGSIRAFRTRAECLDIGTPADYLETSLLVARREGVAGSAPRHPAHSGGHLAGARADIAPDARIERSILWDDVAVGAGAMLHECIVTDGVRVPAETSWRGVTLRAADGELAPGERRIGDLAVSNL
jgi:NDP-sugar pyrophosphorylase family protein